MRRRTRVFVEERVRRFLGISAEMAGDESFLYPAGLDFVSDALGAMRGIAKDWQLLCEAAQPLGSHALDPSRLLVSRVLAAQLFGPTRSERFEALAQQLLRCLDYVQQLARSRVEHQELSHGIVVRHDGRADMMAPRGEDVPVGFYPDDFCNLKRTPLLSDGRSAALCMSPVGAVTGLVTRASLDAEVVRDREESLGALGFMAAATEVYRGVGLLLLPDGTLHALSQGVPLLVERRGCWRGLLWEPVRTALYRRFPSFGGVVLNAAIAMATSGRGGLFGLIPAGGDLGGLGLHDKDNVPLAHESAARADFPPPPNRCLPGAAYPGGVFSPRHPEWRFHLLLRRPSVPEIGAHALADLASIDGATVIDTSGRLLAYGAVLPTESSQLEGARTAAARTLSQRGLTIKVSADGPITIYERGELLLEI